MKRFKSICRVEKFFSEINDNRGEICFNVKFYICKLKNDKMEVTEHFDYKWVEPKDIVDAEFMEDDKEILDKLRINYK